MIRRTFLPWLGGGISSSFLAGASGGAAASAGAAAIGLWATSEPWSRRSYSQQGEDLIIQSICACLGIRNPAYLDVGAADPTRINNTYLFYRAGCRGVLVEPNPASCRRLRSVRPGDVVLNVGIGFGDRKEGDYYMIGGPGGDDNNTFSKGEAESYAAKTKGRNYLERVVKMPLVSINEVMKKYFRVAPDFISIDTEGLDFDILKSLDFDGFRPGILCVETLVYGTKRVRTEILELMKSKGYTVRGATFVNTIFVDDRLLGS